MKVVVVNHCRGLRVDRELLAKVARFVTARHEITSGQIEVAIMDDKEIARLHKSYFGRRAVTDVISFDLTENEKGSRFEVSLALGGEVARRQARKLKTSINKELCLYTAHGLLHAMGYDDKGPRKAARMHAREDELLTELGLGKVYRKQTT